MKGDLRLAKIYKFPGDLNREEACLKTVVESWYGDYGPQYVEKVLVELVNYASDLNIEEDLLAMELYLNLNTTLLLWRDLNDH